MSKLPACISKLSRLQYMHLKYNQISEIDPQLGNLVALKEVDLEGNRLSTLPDSFSNLRNLEKIYINRNHLNEIPKCLKEMTGLTELIINHNHLAQIDYLTNLTNLRTLNIASNDITIFPVGFSKLALLKDFDCNCNSIRDFTNFIPCSSFTALQVLNISGNELRFLPSEIGALTTLEKILVNENELAILPTEIGLLTNVVELNLDENKLQQIPREIGRMSKLEVLNINQNDLFDLPNEIYNLPLRMFGIDDNPLDEVPLNIVEGGSQEVFDYLGQRLNGGAGGQ
eukprot:TRINITY_DN13361_c0_g1_i1.p1 TRINITY_DN13361_c0_g1~~TRINITY_DN13361_c0_g1_i1.p1  ORF type:complete len:285 (+),score=44.87 TRINITY_DN13361_c0_g1_i1:132-986(+)